MRAQIHGFGQALPLLEHNPLPGLRGLTVELALREIALTDGELILEPHVALPDVEPVSGFALYTPLMQGVQEAWGLA